MVHFRTDQEREGFQMNAKQFDFVKVLCSMVAVCFFLAPSGMAATTTGTIVLAFEEEVYSSAGASGDEFGKAAALCGDTALIGAAMADGASTSDSGAAMFFERDGNGWSELAAFEPPDPEDGNHFGVSVAISGTVAVVGAHRDNDNGSESGSAYVYEKIGASWIYRQKLTASDGTSQDFFGEAVATNGDTIFVSCTGDDDGASGAGSVYLFEKSGDAWQESGKLVASDPAMSDSFGSAVAVSGDILIVGTPLDDSPDQDAGSVYIFDRFGGSWSQSAKLVASDAASFDRFGNSVGICGGRAIVGAPYEDQVGADSGSAYIFELSRGVWTETDKIWASDGAGSDSFGAAVALWEDVAVAGAPFNDSIGSVYCFLKQGGSWKETRKIRAWEADAGDDFGQGAALCGDTILAGSSSGDGGNAGTGTAFLYSLVPSTEHKITADDAGFGDYFGQAVDVYGDTAIIGAYGDDQKDLNAGAAYIYTRSGNSWTESQKLMAPDGGSGDYFGWAVSIDGNTAVVGSYGDNDAGNDTGSAYVFTESGGGWSYSQKLLADDMAAGDQFGWSVDVRGDRIIVGARHDSDIASWAGAAYVFKKSGSVWNQEAELLASDGVVADYFGHDVAIQGDTALVAAHLDDDKGFQSGSVYVFNYDVATSWTQSQKLNAYDGLLSDEFGWSVDVDGDIAAIGAWSRDLHGANSGAVYVFRESGGTWSHEARLSHADADDLDYLGRSVSVDGDMIFAGADGDDEGGLITGTCFLFRYRNSSWEQLDKFTAGDADAGDFYGSTAGISGEWVMTGAKGNADAGTNSGSAYFYRLDRTPPEISSIFRCDPMDEGTNVTTATCMVSFSETVHNVLENNFSITATGGQTASSIGSVSNNCGTTRTVSMETAPEAQGSIRLDLSDPNTITDGWYNVLTQTRTGDESYLVDRLAPMVSITRQPPGGHVDDVRVDFALSFNGPCTATIMVEWSDDGGGSWHGTTSFTGASSGLATSLAGTEHSITWNSLADTGNRDDTFKLKITARDDTKAGQWGLFPGITGEFTVLNQTVPVEISVFEVR